MEIQVTRKKYKRKSRSLFSLNPFSVLMCLASFWWHTFLSSPCCTSPLFHGETAGPLIITEWNGMDGLIPASNSTKASVATLPLIVLCWCVCGDRTRSNGYKLKEEKFRLHIRKKLFTVSVVRYRNRFPREVWACPNPHSVQSQAGLGLV